MNESMYLLLKMVVFQPAMLVYQRVGEGVFRCISDLCQIFRVFPCMFGVSVGHQIICHKASSQNLGASLQKGML